MTDNGGIQIDVIWWDDDVLKCQVTCSNQCFSGRANIYCSHSAPSEMAGVLSGFPSNMRDSRTLELGTFNPNHAEGGVRLHFYCVDSAGHAEVNVQLRSDTSQSTGKEESVDLQIPLEAAAIDSFLAQLRGMKVETGATASLPMAI